MISSLKVLAICYSKIFILETIGTLKFHVYERTLLIIFKLVYRILKIIQKS